MTLSSLIFTDFLLGRITGASIHEAHSFQQPLIALLASYQDGTKTGLKYNHTTWFLVDL